MVIDLNKKGFKKDCEKITEHMKKDLEAERKPNKRLMQCKLCNLSKNRLEKRVVVQ